MTPSTTAASVDQLAATARTLLEYCHGRQWKGYDPYDALNSVFLGRVPFLNARLPRLVVTQLLKRSPCNLRPLLSIPETENPKALALFVMAVLKLSRHVDVAGHDLVAELIARLVALRARPSPYWCWGYSFPWQTRTDLVPRGTPNLVCTTFVAGALLDAYEATHELALLDMAVSAGEYLIDELYWCEGDSGCGFGYPLPTWRTSVHNANFLGAALLARLFAHTGGEQFLAPALRVARYSAGRQRGDGAWPYAESATHRWADNFHTGYNLTALRSIGLHADTAEFEPHVRRGFEFYRRHFFRRDGAPKYFHDRVYPIDIHSAAQSIITLLTLADLEPGNADLARRVYRWTEEHLRDARGYFYYQTQRLYTTKIPYMRWAQAWMLLALAYLLERYPSHADPAARNAAA